MIFFEYITQLVKRISAEAKETNFIGDFNIDPLRRDNPNSRRLKYLMANFSLHWIIDKQTCIAEQSETILDHHSKVLNCGIQSGICPSALKLARVTPVHKSGPASDPNNFRPISVLPIISKLLERYMYSVNAIPTFI